jgi:hypothetical protein
MAVALVVVRTSVAHDVAEHWECNTIMHRGSAGRTLLSCAVSTELMIAAFTTISAAESSRPLAPTWLRLMDASDMARLSMLVVPPAARPAKPIIISIAAKQAKRIE